VTDVLGYIATILSLLGNVFIVRKSKWGFIVWTAGNLVWIYVDISIGLYSQIVMMATYSALNIWGLIEWREK
jgi:nicotinamide riboside transporter PnuC